MDLGSSNGDQKVVRSPLNHCIVYDQRWLKHIWLALGMWRLKFWLPTKQSTSSWTKSFGHHLNNLQLTTKIFWSMSDGNWIFSIVNYPHGPLVIKKNWLPSKDVRQPHVASTCDHCWMVIDFFYRQFFWVPLVLGVPLI
jgi:hypothetical protein